MKSRLAIISFALLFFFAKTLPVFCQQIIFNKVLPPEGKFIPLVTCTTQDINGYMWFATPPGLYSYDGYRFITYVHDSSNPRSLAANFIESIYAHSNGIIWAGTYGAALDRLENNKLQALELQNSQEAFIPLERELEALQLYLELDNTGAIKVFSEILALSRQRNGFLESRYFLNKAI